LPAVGSGECYEPSNGTRLSTRVATIDETARHAKRTMKRFTGRSIVNPDSFEFRRIRSKCAGGAIQHRTRGVSRGYGAQFRSSPVGAKHESGLLSPLRGSKHSPSETHGLRRGLPCLCAGAILPWPLERQGGPRPRSGRCNSSPHACGVPPGMKRAECRRQRTAVFHSSRGSRVGERSEQARDPRIPEPRCADRGAVALDVDGVRIANKSKRFRRA